VRSVTFGLVSDVVAPAIPAEAQTAVQAPRRGPGKHVSFPELVWAHFLRQRELKQGNVYEGEAERRYREFEAAFEDRYGEIVSAYWCLREASGVALTVRHRPGMLPDTVRLHWATDWATKDVPQLTSLLYRCETIAVQVGEVLRDTSARVAMHRLFNAVSYVLAFAESSGVKDEKLIEQAIASQTEELDDLQRYYRNAAGRSGQITYLGGALLGVLPFLLLALVAALFGVFDAGRDAVRTGAVCFTAGSVGALVSVMSRMNSGRVGLDWQFGRDTLRTLGSLRPFVGGIFGLMTFFGLKSGLIALDLGDGEKNFYFYVLFSFAAGFSERLAQDMLLAGAIGRVTGAGPPPPDPAAAPTPPPPEPPVTAEGQLSGEVSDDPQSGA
jgi:hypothetical protein